MLAAPFIYEESMNDSELHYLQQERDKEKKVLVRTVRAITFIFVILPCCLGLFMEYISRRAQTAEWVRIREEEEPHAYALYILGMFVLLILVALIAYYAYTRSLKKLVRDINTGNKTVERTTVTRKQFIPTNETYHLYLGSRAKLSIEVTQQEFEHYEAGDEINIEYSSYARVYFGYF